jgi:uncharacterized protein (TIGR00290 family)
MQTLKALFNWSGGKDSSLCLYHVLQQKEYEISCLLTSVNEHYGRVSMHGVRAELLEKQAESIGLPLQKLMLPEMPTMEVYDETLKKMMLSMKERGIEHSIFGDIFLEDLRTYREDQLAKVGMKGVFPLWRKDTTYLLEEFIDLGFKAILVCVNEKYLDKSFAGRLIDKDFLKDLPNGVDPCGEYGEYHTFVYDGPIYKYPIPVERGEVVYRSYAPPKEDIDDKDTCFSNRPQSYDTGFWYCDLLLKEEPTRVSE